jgi:phosphoglycerate dehydrogenase-like enzyme
MPKTNVMIDVRLDESALERLRARGDLEITVTAVGEEDQEPEREHDPQMLAQQDILFCSFLPTNHRAMKRLRLIQIASAGYEFLLGLDLPGRGVRACNASGVFDVAIAEWNVAMMVNLARDLRQMIRNQDAGHWDREARFESEICGATVGLWGYGGLARQTARLCKALGQTVWVLTRDGVKPRPNSFAVPGTGDAEGVLPDRVFTTDEKQQFLSGLDFLILALPLNPSTEGIVGDDELRALPRHCLLLNPARGPLLKEESLLRALREGWVAGAALDTHFYYPMPPEHPLWRMPNVIMTPHISGSARTPCFLPRIWSIFSQNVERFIDGSPLINELTAAQLQR